MLELFAVATYHEAAGFAPFRCELDIEEQAPRYEDEGSFETFTDLLRLIWEVGDVKEYYEASMYDIAEHGGVTMPEPDGIDVLTPEGEHVFRWYAESMDGDGLLVKGTEHDEFYGVNS